MLTRIILIPFILVIIGEVSICFAGTPDNLLELQALLTMARGDYKGAVEVYSKIIKKIPNSENAYRLRSYAYSQLKMFDKALDDANFTIKTNPKNYENYGNRAYIYKATGRTDESIKDYTNALALCPQREFSLSLGSDGFDFRRNDNKAKLLYSRARLYLKIAKEEKAKSDLELAITLDPKNKESKKLLKSILEKRK